MAAILAMVTAETEPATIFWAGAAYLPAVGDSHDRSLVPSIVTLDLRYVSIRSSETYASTNAERLE